MNIWFEYKYIPLNKIMDNIKLISDFNLSEFIILFSIITFTLLLIFYIVPFFSMILDEREKTKKKAEKKKFISQIIIQKDIENEIEEEIKNYNLLK